MPSEPPPPLALDAVGVPSPGEALNPGMGPLASGPAAIPGAAAPAKRARPPGADTEPAEKVYKRPRVRGHAGADAGGRRASDSSGGGGGGAATEGQSVSSGSAGAPEAKGLQGVAGPQGGADGAAEMRAAAAAVRKAGAAGGAAGAGVAKQLARLLQAVQVHASQTTRATVPDCCTT